MSALLPQGPLTYTLVECGCGARNVNYMNLPVRPFHQPGCPNDGKPEEAWPEWPAWTEETPLLVIDT